MGRQTTKRCHWVSQAYLKAFTVDAAASSPKIWRFGKTGGEPELKPVEKVAVKFHLYSPKGPDGRRDDSLERKFASLEHVFGEPIWRELLCADFVDLDWEPLRKTVALLTATTYLRNPLRFEEVKAMHHELVGLITSGPTLPDATSINGSVYPLDHSNWPAFRDADEDGIKRIWIEQVSTATWLAEILLKMRWSMIFSEEPVFITSDNPVAILHPSLKFRGISDPETTVSFPVSPTRILMMDNRHHEPASQYYPLRHDPGISNCLIWRNAIEYMFSPRHPDIICAEMLAEAERAGFA